MTSVISQPEKMMLDGANFVRVANTLKLKVALAYGLFLIDNIQYHLHRQLEKLRF